MIYVNLQCLQRRLPRTVFFRLRCVTANMKVIKTQEPTQSKQFPKGELLGKGLVEPHLLTVLTLERDYPSETGYPWDNSRQTDNTS